MCQKQHAPVPMAEATVEPEEPAPAPADEPAPADAPAPPEEPAPPASEEPAPVDPPDAPGQEKDGEGAVAGNAVEPAPAPKAPPAKPGFRVPRRYEAPLEVITDAKAMRAWSRAHRIAGRRVALVPTMGYLHDGHLSLVRAAMDRADAIVVSIYVNPAQFAAQEDFGTYPRDQDGDLAKLRALGVHAVFQPEGLYAGRAPHGHDEAAAAAGGKEKGKAQGTDEKEKEKAAVPDTKGDVPPHETFVTVEELQRGFCSETRPHFFRGVATVVCKLFNICEPDVAVFGKKDYQQWRLIRRMVRDLDFEIDVVGVPLAREPDGLAMSSRNVRLTPQHRKNAVRISEAIALVKEVCELAVVNGTPKDSTHFKGLICQAIANSGGVVDYVDIVEQRTLKPVEWPLRGPIPATPQVILVAAKYGNVRLLDNVELFGTAD